MEGRVGEVAEAGAVVRAGAPAVSLGNVTISFRLADGGSYTAVEGASPAVLRDLELEHLNSTWCHEDHWRAHDAVLARISR